MSRILCPICESPGEKKPYFRSLQDKLRVCENCRLVFVYPRLSVEELQCQYSADYFERKYWNNLDTEYVNSEVWRSKLCHCLNYSARLCRTGSSPDSKKRVLDVGCGIGKFLEVAISEGWQPTGLELSSSVAEKTAQRLQIPVHAGSLFDVDLPREYFDVVTLFEVIEHLEDPLAALRRCFQALKPGGVLTMSTPNFSGLGRRLVGSDAFGIWPEEHVFYFTAQTLTLTLRKAGFDRIRIQTRDLYPENVAMLVERVRRMLPQKGSGGHESQVELIKNNARSRPMLRWMRRFANFFFAHIALGDEMVSYAVKPVQEVVGEKV